MTKSWTELAKEVVHGKKLDDKSTNLYADLLKSCKSLLDGRRLHGEILESRHHRNVFLTNLVIEMYGKCGSVEDARKVFDNLRNPNIFSWNIMVAAYAQNGNGSEAKNLFDKMPVKDSVSWNVMMAMYAQKGHVEEAKRTFDHSPCKNDYSWNTMISAYSQYGYVEQARSMLVRMPRRDRFSWTTVISAYANTGQSKEAVLLFRMMDLEGIEADCVTFTTVLDACASHSTLSDGKAIHSSMIESGLEMSRVVATSLVNMYGKCGRVVQAKAVFEQVKVADVMLWTCLIACYTQWGHGREAVDSFRIMQAEGINPDRVIFIAVLCACSHAGLLELGLELLAWMRPDYGIHLDVEHYACMVDLVARAGWLSHAEELLERMPFEPDGACWTAMLAACRLHKDKERARRASERVYELDPGNAAPYALLINTDRDSSSEANRLRMWRGVRKVAGRSSIVIRDKVHEFIAGDVQHPEAEQVYAELERLKGALKEAGYVPDTAAVAFESMSEEDKEKAVYSHSEKLAVAFGLISTPRGTPLRVVNNVRMCSDCHSAMKFISSVTEREIVVRDLIRFHSFDRGRCSCNDYW